MKAPLTVPSASWLGFRSPVGVMAWLAFLVGSTVAPDVSAAAVVSSDAELRNQCETKKLAASCFALGFSEMKKQTPASRKLAAQLMKRGCAYQKKKAFCSISEIKVAAQNYRGRDRVPAAAAAAKVVSMPPNVKMIKAPKISPGSAAKPSSPIGSIAPPPPMEMPPPQSVEPMSDPVPQNPPYIPPPPPMPQIGIPPPAPPDGSFSTEPPPQ